MIPGAVPRKLMGRARLPRLRALAGSVLGSAALLSNAPCLHAQTKPAADSPAAPSPAAPVQTVNVTEYRGATALGLALRRMGTTGRILMIGAHPDDENNPMLTRLALGEGADVAYLSLTRGEGGQDAIGADFQEALGIIRSEELLAARRVDGAGQFFGREYDFGFSKSAEETFRHWPRDSVLSDVVRIIRLYRPDVVISVWTGTSRDGHGQHQASGQVAKEAFDASADPARFPEQVREGLAPWAAKKLYEGAYFTLDSATLRLSTGDVDPLFGMSYAQVAAIGRARHRSQDQGQALPVGPQQAGLRLVVDRTGGTPAGPHPESSILAGVDTSLAQRATRLGLGAPAVRLFTVYDSAVASARAAFDPLRPDEAVAALAGAVRALQLADSAGRAAFRGQRPLWLEDEERDATQALALAGRVIFDAVASKEQVVPGDTVDLELTAWNGGSRPVSLVSVRPIVPQGWTVLALGPGSSNQPAPGSTNQRAAGSFAQVAPGSPIQLQPGAREIRRFRVVVPVEAPLTQPYYLRLPRRGDLYTWPAGDPADGSAFQPPPIWGAATVDLDGAVTELTLPVTFRAVNPREGEIRRPLRIVPAISVETEPTVTVLPLASKTPLSLQVRVAAQAPGGVAGTLTLSPPRGWKASPVQVELRLAGSESRAVRVALSPPPGLRPGRYEVLAVFRDTAAHEYVRGFRLIDYPHIRPHPLYRDARTTVQAVDVMVPRALRVGYIMGAGDDVPASLGQLGVHVELLPPGTLSTADLSRFDDVVVGVRAYEVRPELAAANRRLLDWVSRGGTLIVQYQQAAWAQSGMPPYPIAFAGRMGDRVTDETAPVKVVEPASPVLNRPNRITAADWEGWVQERGLWFPRTWDSRYQAPLEMSDPGEPPTRGSLLMARYGKGTYVYTGLSLFRELPAGVPGAYRLFANLLALGRLGR